mmetsp:Transcript_12791/g.27752  ORF Transcript_12791/g.27752 Transcript_12791/m.27752 type:complete len:263 (-) Transcript_12791:56-844(-)
MQNSNSCETDGEGEEVKEQELSLINTTNNNKLVKEKDQQLEEGNKNNLLNNLMDQDDRTEIKKVKAVGKKKNININLNELDSAFSLADEKDELSKGTPNFKNNKFEMGKFNNNNHSLPNLKNLNDNKLDTNKMGNLNNTAFNQSTVSNCVNIDNQSVEKTIENTSSNIKPMRNLDSVTLTATSDINSKNASNISTKSFTSNLKRKANTLENELNLLNEISNFKTPEVQGNSNFDESAKQNQQLEQMLEQKSAKSKTKKKKFI